MYDSYQKFIAYRIIRCHFDYKSTERYISYGILRHFKTENAKEQKDIVLILYYIYIYIYKYENISCFIFYFSSWIYSFSFWIFRQQHPYHHFVQDLSPLDLLSPLHRQHFELIVLVCLQSWGHSCSFPY